MSSDKRAEIVEAMAREMLGRVNAPEQEIYRVAGDLADIALKAAAEIVRNACLVPPDGGAPTKTESEMCDRAAAAILALTSEGEQP